MSERAAAAAAATTTTTNALLVILMLLVGALRFSSFTDSISIAHLLLSMPPVLCILSMAQPLHLKPFIH